MRIGIIGVGKVGASLGQYLAHNNVMISGVFDINATTAATGANLIKTVCFGNLEDLVATSDVLFITVVDDEIASVWKQIAVLDVAEKIICHCSGALASTIFTGIREKGAFGYSVHPAMTISHSSAVGELERAPFTIEGDSERLAVVKDLFAAMGNSVQVLTAANKTRYHAAAVFASNFIVALADISMDILADCGFDKEQQRLFLPLMQASIDTIIKDGIVSALTGPIERGDVGTVEKHLANLSGNEREIYALLSTKIIEIAKQKNPHKDYSDLATFLSKK